MTCAVDPKSPNLISVERLANVSETNALAEALVGDLAPLLHLRPVASNPEGLRQVGIRVAERLAALDFAVKCIAVEGRQDIIVAMRRGSGSFSVGLTGHYDVEEAGEGWTTEPFKVTARDGRLYARGIADNLGPLLLRLSALSLIGPTPPLIVVLQGEEEIGSPAAHEIYPTLNLPRVGLWLEETGYYEFDGTQRLLARRIDQIPAAVQQALDTSAETHGRRVVVHDRYLNKAFGEHRCPFLTHLIGGAPYLAIGPNDPHAFIHRPDESLPLANLAASVHQFQAVIAASVS